MEIHRPKSLANLNSSPVWFDREGYVCEQGDGLYRGDPDGWVMAYRERVAPDDPQVGMVPMDEVDCLARIVGVMHARGYWTRP